MIRAVLLSSLMLSPLSAAVGRTDMAPDGGSNPSADITASGPVQPMVVTSDTGAYCETLSRQLDRRGEALPQRVASLRDQGQHLCAIGQVRGGINRLRRALMVLGDPNGVDDEAADPTDTDGKR